MSEIPSVIDCMKAGLTAKEAILFNLILSEYPQSAVASRDGHFWWPIT